MKKLDRKIRFINFLGNLQETILKSMPITFVIFIFTFIYTINNMKFKKISYCLFGVLILLFVLYILFDGISNKIINMLKREYPLHLHVKDNRCKEIISLFEPLSDIIFLEGPDCLIIAIINNTYIRAKRIDDKDLKIFN